ncbi:MAG: hypothetical protein HQL08_13730 [Nitrospirae bacterium]|nr:hypothetical protein [Nitrospirota bacterium]
MNQEKNYKVLALLLTLLAIVVLTGCGGGGGGTSLTPSTGNTTGSTNSSTIISGLASKGPVSNGTASVYSITNGQMGSLLATSTTMSDGTFSASLGAYNGPIMVQVTGGSYVDEATGKTAQMGSMVLRTAVDNAAGNVSVAVTPLTEAAVQYMGGTLTTNMITLANTMMATKFGMSDIVHTLPHDVSATAVTGQDSQTYYGLMLAAMSQMASTDNLSISTIMSNIANDLKDTSSAGTQALTSLMSTMSQRFSDFETKNSNNKTGVTTMSPGGMMSTGGTGSTGGSTNGTMVGSTMINGLASKGPIANGTVSIYAITNGQVGNLIASTTTGQDGSFTANMGSYTSAMLVQVTGGSYMDEATGKTVQMGSMVLRTALSNASGNASVAVTPLTETAVQYMGNAMTSDMITLANTMMGTEFGVNDIVHTMPMNVTASSAAGNTSSAYYGMMLAGMSQTAAANNISISTIMSTIANSLKDTSSSGSQTLTSMMTLMSQNFTQFETSNTNNKSGVTNMSPGGMMATLGGMMGSTNGTKTGGTNGTTGGMMR